MKEHMTIVAAGLIISLILIVAGTTGGSPDVVQVGILGVICSCGYVAWVVRD